ncbi:hypothetical protein GCM10028822_13440 [Hymenobacter terrigena]
MGGHSGAVAAARSRAAAAEAPAAGAGSVVVFGYVDDGGRGRGLALVGSEAGDDCFKGGPNEFPYFNAYRCQNFHRQPAKRHYFQARTPAGSGPEPARGNKSFFRYRPTAIICWCSCRVGWHFNGRFSSFGFKRPGGSTGLQGGSSAGIGCYFGFGWGNGFRCDRVGCRCFGCSGGLCWYFGPGRP